MDFRLSDEQRAAQEMAHDFAARELRPIALECDLAHAFPPDLLGKAAALGLNSMGIPPEYGGAGFDHVTQALIYEELAWGCAGLAATIMGTMLAAYPVMLGGTPEQQQVWLTRLADPRGTYGAIAITEAGAGSDAAAMTTRAIREGDFYRLRGAKRFITNGGIGDVYVVFATLDPGQGGKAICAFLVDGHAPGVSAGKKERKIGLCASHTGEILLDDVRVPAADRLGPEGAGFGAVLRFFQASRPMVGAVAVGIARAAYEAALAYAFEREQFGSVVFKNQGVSFPLADMAIQIEAARNLVHKACWLLDTGQDAGLAGSFAKCFATDMAMQVADAAVQVLGGYGLMHEYHVEKWLRDAKVLQIVEGTNQIQRLIVNDYQARAMARRPAAKA
ncbi:MAG: acyl-CoA dehydrogenase family protein [Candidatus Sericytochromatia bacterium]|nr:acyl-CoA dehydrogenase family protein [Candidatus Tanganyikabacteria bacterium]